MKIVDYTYTTGYSFLLLYCFKSEISINSLKYLIV